MTEPAAPIRPTASAEGRHHPGSPDASDPLAVVQGALDRGDWTGALALLGDPAEADDAALELRAQALYADGQFEASVATWEALHARFLARAEPVAAARAAAMVALYLMIDTGLMAPVRGWLRRADGLLAGRADGPGHALIALVRTYERFMSGDVDAARDQAARAVALGDRHGVAPAAVVGRVAGARIRIFDGDVEGGLDELDEVAVLLMSGEVDPLTTGMMYCELICASQGLSLHDRARDWTQTMDRWRPGAALGGISGRCRVHRAEILRITGPCDQAETEALGACEELRPWMRREFGWPLAELGNIRLRKGDLAGAEEAFLAAHGHAWSPQPGLALVRLAQGEVQVASTMIDDAIAHPLDIPSKERPPIGELRLAPLLDAQAEIAAAAGDDATAAAAAAHLRAIAQRYRSPGLDAAASLAEARAALLAGRVEPAIERSGRAMVAWAEMGAPFEAAVARTVLAEARARSGDDVGARMEWQAARAAFDAYGAPGWAARAAARAVAPAEPTPPPVAAPRRATFRRSGDIRTVQYGDHVAVLRDLKGFRYLERLLAQPGRELHVLDLVAGERGARPSGGADEGTPGWDGPVEAGLPVLDDEARAAYRRRLADVDDDIDEATRMNDAGRLELACRDRDYLIAELTRAAGLGGRGRTTGGTAERARTSVARSIRYALTGLARHHPSLAAHLTTSIRTGSYCSYAPDPLSPMQWEL